jgi:hypothetical protein
MRLNLSSRLEEMIRPAFLTRAAGSRPVPYPISIWSLSFSDPWMDLSCLPRSLPLSSP